MANKIQTLQPVVSRQLQQSFLKKRVAHAFLFAGDQGTGKSLAAIWFAQLLFCSNSDKYETAEPCQVCHNCQRIAQKEHPDVQYLVPTGQTIKVDQIRELKDSFIKSGVETRQKVIVIEDADKMTRSASNSLLKFIEEPFGQILIIFLTKNQPGILPTIQSRCQIFHFINLAEDNLLATLQNEQVPVSLAGVLSKLAQNLDEAHQLMTDDWFSHAYEEVTHWYELIKQQDWYSFIYIQQKLTKTFKDKEQQKLALQVLTYQFQQDIPTKETNLSIWSEKQWVRAMELLTEASQKFQANVSFQNVCEQFILRMFTKLD